MNEGYRPKPKEPEKEEISEGRRKFFSGAATAGIAGALGVTVYGLHEDGKKEFTNPEKDSSSKEKILKEEIFKAPPAPFHRGPFPTGDIAGRPVADLFAFYLGLPEHSKIPESIDPDFGTIMHELWQKKIAFVQRSNHPDWINNTLKAEKHFGEGYTEAWKEGNLTQQTLPDLVRDAGKVIEETREGFNWDHFHENNRYGKLFGPEESDLVHQLSKNITPEMLVSYSVTELLPFEGEKDPMLRKMPLDVFETLLLRAGREFVVNLPSIYDPYLSTGMFQFTSFALYENGKETRGASHLNKLIQDPNNRLPSSVLQLDTAEKQIRAAYMFCLDNLACLVTQIANDRGRGRDKKCMYTLRENAHTLNEGILQYIASAHHNPSEGRKAFIEWIDKDFQGSHADLCGPHIRNYVRSAHVNFEELQKRM